MDKDELRLRTKEFALRTMKLVDARLDRDLQSQLLTNWCVAGLLLPVTIERPAGRVREPNLLLGLVSLRKKLTRVLFGWS